MQGIYLGGLSDMASGFASTAQNAPTGEANMILAKFITAISFLITIVGVAYCYIVPAKFIVSAAIECTPLVNLFHSSSSYGGGMGGSGGGFLDWLKQNTPNFLVSFLFMLNAASGLWATELSLLSSGLAAGIQKIVNAGWNTADSPASIKQFKDDVNAYSASQCAQLYESYLNTEREQEQNLVRYVQSNHPDAQDENYTRLKANYTATVCREQILAQKLNKANYAKDIGISDPNFFKQHLQQDNPNSNVTAPFNPAFVVNSMAQSFGVQGLPSGANN